MCGWIGSSQGDWMACHSRPAGFARLLDEPSRPRHCSWGIFTSFFLDSGLTRALLQCGNWGKEDGGSRGVTLPCTFLLAPWTLHPVVASKRASLGMGIVSIRSRRIFITRAKFCCSISRKFDCTTLSQTCTRWRLDISQLGFQPRFWDCIR